MFLYWYGGGGREEKGKYGRKGEGEERVVEIRLLLKVAAGAVRFKAPFLSQSLLNEEFFCGNTV